MAYYGKGTSGQVLTDQTTPSMSKFAASTGGSMLTAQVTLTSVQIKALHATPIEIVAAPGAGKMICPIQTFTKFLYGGSNVFIAGAGQSIRLYYGTSDPIGTVVTNVALTASSTAWNNVFLNIVSPTLNNLENLHVVLYNDNATEITGNAANDNTVEVILNYYIFTL